MTEEGFREIQLNGKQLVFLFMAATVVSVVIFLCGVLVGRGVRSDRPAAADAASAAVAPDPVEAPTPQASAASTPTPSAEPPAPAEELTYFDRLEKDGPARENLKSSSPEPAQASASASPAVAAPPAPAAQPPSAGTHPAAAVAGEPSGPGFAVQVMTFSDRGGADTLVKQLIKKGYPAFATGPVASGSRSIYRVRVGKYKNLREAEAVSRRLKTEEQFNPWIAR